MEEETPPSSENTSKIKDNSYSSELQSKVDEESTFGYLAEQAEALQEMSSLKWKEPMVISEGPPEAQKESQINRPPSPQSKPKTEVSEDSFDYTLYLQFPPGIERIEDTPVGMEVTWERDPVRAAEDRKKWALEREAEARKKQGNQGQESQGQAWSQAKIVFSFLISVGLVASNNCENADYKNCFL